MRNRSVKWLGGIGSLVLIGGLLLEGYGVASAASPTTEEILAKLNELLIAVGSIKEGNHTLRWDQNLPTAQRFVILPAFNNAAVLDKNTGLVWEQSPATTAYDWTTAGFQCANRTTGGQKGWRLPSFVELSSLVDPSVAVSGPTLPPGHPFANVPSANYWSASAVADLPSVAWFVGFGSGIVGTGLKTSSIPVWCVRGPMQESVY